METSTSPFDLTATSVGKVRCMLLCTVSISEMPKRQIKVLLVCRDFACDQQLLIWIFCTDFNMSLVMFEK